jgi:hypothetical protein
MLRQRWVTGTSANWRRSVEETGRAWTGRPGHWSDATQDVVVRADRIVTGFPRPGGPWPAIRRDLDRHSRRPVIAVVAYVGTEAPAVMPLREGDWLICDASDAAVKGRLTSVAALRVYRRRKVRLFSLDGLHAKVIASPTSAWIGSANASENSEDALIEAAVRVTGVQARSLHDWACSLATEEAELTAADLRRLGTLKLSSPRKAPTRKRIPHELPETANRLTFWILRYNVTKAEQAAIDKERPHARRDARSAEVPSTLEAVAFRGATVLKAGDWLVTLRDNRVQAPGYVVRVTRDGRGGRAWISRVRTRRRPSMTALTALVPNLDDERLEIVVRSTKKIGSVLDSYR